MKEDAKQTILVTGGAGFIGSHLTEALLKEGHRVISLDNYFTGSRDNHTSGAEYREGHTKDIERLIPEQIDLIYHLGEYSRVEKSFEDIEILWGLNNVGTLAVLEFWRKRNCKIIYAGSSTKFSDNGEGKNQSPYAWVKATNTELIKNYATWFGLPYVITYFYNVYGPREITKGPFATVLGIFKEEYSQGNPLTIVLPGTQRRNFTHINDIISGLILAGEKGEGDDYGIGNAESYSIREVAEMFDGQLILMPERAGNRLSSEVDTVKLNALGWFAKVSLKEHVKQFKAKYVPKPKGERKVLVFSTTFYPCVGPAEQALCMLAESMSDVQFDVITTAYSKQSGSEVCPIKNVTVHYVGRGSMLDKFLLPLTGSRKAKELARKNKYIFGWSLMASYGALASLLFKRKTGVPILITLADQKLSSVPFYFKIPLQFILGHADQVYSTTPEQSSFISMLTTEGIPINSVGLGDAFANQLRVAYRDFLKKEVR